MKTKILILTAVALGVAAPIHAQDAAAMDMTGMSIYSQEDSMLDAAKETSSRPRTARKAVPTGINTQTRRHCAKARDGVSYSRDNPVLPKLLAACSKAGL